MSLYDAFEVAAAAVIPNQEMLVLKLHISILLGNRMLQISSLRRRSKRKQAGDCGALGSLRIRFYSSLSAFQWSSWCITYLVNGIYGTYSSGVRIFTFESIPTEYSTTPYDTTYRHIQYGIYVTL